tara:strand:- start:12018 stop:12287 length:270 start_codon:yes stop_codon:yes gene_type:complete
MASIAAIMPILSAVSAGVSIFSGVKGLMGGKPKAPAPNLMTNAPQPSYEDVSDPLRKPIMAAYSSLASGSRNFDNRSNSRFGLGGGLNI